MSHVPHLLLQMTPSGIVSAGTILYDTFGRRVRVRTFGVRGNETFHVDQLMLFNQVGNFTLIRSN